MGKNNSFVVSGNKIPLLILLIWISIIGYFIWQRVNQSDRPPIHDAFTYYEKARNFWDNAKKGFPENPFNLNFVVRPPGTVLMSYPLGFSKDYHGFLFRSIFFPFLIWVVSILILIWPKGENKDRSHWPTVLLIFLLGPMPFFFQFDFGRTAYWGLVDSFLAAMSALSWAIALKSIEKRSTPYLITAVLITAICPLIKPSGYLIFFLIAFFWGLINLWAVLNKYNPEKKTSIKFLGMGSALFFIVGIIILYLGISSEYLGHNSTKYLTHAMSILNDESKEYISFRVFITLFYDAVGPLFFLYFPLGVFLWIRYRNTLNMRIPFFPLFFSGFIFITIGIWFWVWMTGISQIRYFYPFLLLGLGTFIYYSNEIIIKQALKLIPFIRPLINLICILPALNIILLLSKVNPNNRWQEISGVSVNISRNDQGVKIAKQFLSLIENENQPANVYDINMGAYNNSFVSYGFYDHVIHPEAKGFYCISPIDWIHPSTYRLNEIILKSDYILFQPISTESQIVALSDLTTNSFDEERIVIEAFLNSLTPAQGLQTLFVEKDCRLSKIIDKVKLMHTFEQFIYSRHWRPLFMEENGITQQEWKLFEEPYQDLTQVYSKDTSTLYRGSIDLLNGILTPTDTIRINSFLTVEGWLAYDPENGIKADKIFVVLTDPGGNQQYWPADPVFRPDVSLAFHQPLMRDAGFAAKINLNDKKGLYTLTLALIFKDKLVQCNSLNRIVVYQ